MKMENMREAYGTELVALGKDNPAVVALEADLGKSTRSCLFEDAFPKRFFEMGIAEANMASVAAGLALTGKIPFIHSFAVFAAGRIYDQLRQSISIPALNVKICGSSSGLSDFGDGSTHQAVEDVALMRAIPNMTVLVPADAAETRKMVRAAAEHAGPVYIRINRNDLPVYTEETAPYRIGMTPVLREGSDAVVFANGVMVSRAMDAADRLAREGVSVRVVNVSTMKPFNEENVIELAAGMKTIVAAEEHSVIGGLGAAVAAALRAQAHAPIEFVGIADTFGTSAANYDELLAHYGLTADAVYAAIRRHV